MQNELLRQKEQTNGGRSLVQEKVSLDKLPPNAAQVPVWGSSPVTLVLEEGLGGSKELLVASFFGSWETVIRIHSKYAHAMSRFVFVSSGSLRARLYCFCLVFLGSNEEVVTFGCSLTYGLLSDCEFTCLFWKTGAWILFHF